MIYRKKRESNTVIRFDAISQSRCQNRIRGEEGYETNEKED